MQAAAPQVRLGSRPLDDDDRAVIGGAAPFRVGFHLGLYELLELRRRERLVVANNDLEPVFAELLFVLAPSLADAVGENDEDIASLELRLSLVEGGGIEESENRPAFLEARHRVGCFL